MANKADQAYDVLERMITFQELPPGSLVSEARLMERTGLGRTPVREALQRLARERMVEIHPSQGVFVASTSIEAQLKVLELRRSLEELAVRLAAHRATTAQRDGILELAEVLAGFDGDDPEEFGDLLKQTHTVIVDASHNEFISLAMAPLQGLSRRFWFAHLREPKSELRAAADLHGDILRAICHGDETKASEASLKLNDYLTDFTYRTLRNQ
ncbi:GntR family transcriptional regulator [Amycolatopsis acidicola]|uniref:GntR family transcriptional regulator n=1 Tax=Amycolatopsis acidicola TaxID=2596893 RepID=A0A5N0UYS0_9PSEU|nr:GntR family transcriptional regulator [Amycolatopsis acidicola]KAA9156577.1 GntR family transcriptional regulator [Amycolatopsis acidicola]